MVKDFKYIIKRIIIGVGIALILMFIKKGVYALEVSPYNLGESPTFVISNLNTNVSYSVSGNPYSVHNGSSGYINFAFSVFKVGGSSTAALVMPRGASVTFGSSAYICNIGSVSANNSTFNSQVYSARCPVTVNSSGLTQIYIAFQDLQANDNSSYRVVINSGISYEIMENTNVNVNVNNNGTIQNDNQNTQSIINNQNSNTQSIINNQNSNTESINNTLNDNLQTCSAPTHYSTINNAYLDTSGRLRTSTSSNDIVYVYQVPNLGINYSFVFNSYDRIRVIETDQVISPGGSGTATHTMLINTSSPIVGDTYSVFASKRYLYFYLSTTSNVGSITFNDSCVSKIDETNNAINNVNNTINDDNVDNANNEGSDFFNNFQSNSHGLSGIITAPLRLINSLTTASCSPLTFQLPFVHDQVSLPCMRGIYETHFGVFFTLYQLITTGLICYAVMINIYSKVHALQNPNNDRIEVLNL